MAIEKEIFVQWAEKYFDKVDVRGDEVRVNSIFAESDSKQHLWCNPAGGKNQRPYGVYHCWKTDRKGSLVSLVMEIEKCDFKSALGILGISRQRGRPIEEFEEIETDEVPTWDIILETKTLSLPPYTHKLTQAPENWYQRARNYLLDRKIQLDNLFICIGGRFHGRIIIPYYSQNNDLIYFNGRTIIGDDLRYKGPDKDCGIGKEDVLFFTNYPEKGSKLYLCEGEFDALSLFYAGFNAVACGGKNLSDKQAAMLSNYRVCLALDMDEAGQSAVLKMQQKLTLFCLINPTNRITKACPPSQCKDWNSFLCNFDAKILKSYIEKIEENLESEQPYGYESTKKKP